MVIVPINTDEDGNARCIKTTYLKAGLTNFMRAEWGGQKMDSPLLQSQSTASLPKEFLPLNAMPDGTCRTIKYQYQQSSTANFLSTGTFGATGVIEYG